MKLKKENITDARIDENDIDKCEVLRSEPKSEVKYWLEECVEEVGPGIRRVKYYRCEN